MKTHFVYHASWGMTDCGIPLNPTGFWKKPVPRANSIEETTCGNCKRAQQRRETAQRFRETMQQTRKQA